jgi:hypothetical protein
VSHRRLAALAAALALAAACSGGGDDEPAAPPAGQAGQPPSPAAAGGPLTGLPIDAARAGRPALIVKIDNAPRARPQAGINQADVVIEEAVEGGVTRFATIFHSSDADSVGPVRSARSTDILIAGALNRPLFAYSGANTVFQRQLAGSPLVDVGVDRFPGDYRRQAGRPAPYNLFSGTAPLFSHTPPGAGPPPALFPFRPAGRPASGAGAAPAGGVSVEYRGNIVTAVQYAWDQASGTWRRSQDGRPHVDAAGAQVAPKNVVVQFVRYRDTGLRDRSGAVVPEGEIQGEGEAWVLTDGKIVRGRWRKPTAQAVTQYVDGAGAPVPLTPGQTWVELPSPGQARLT